MKVTGFSRASKDLMIQSLERDLKAYPTFFITEYTGVSASMMDKLRARLRKEKTRYVAVKNSLSKRVFSKSLLKPLAEHFNGACGLALSGADPVGPSRVLVEFAKENESFKIQAALINGQPVSVADVKTLASLPPKNVLLAKVLGQMNAPISGFVGVLSGTLRKLVTALDAIAKKKGEGQ